MSENPVTETNVHVITDAPAPSTEETEVPAKKKFFTKKVIALTTVATAAVVGALYLKGKSSDNASPEAPETWSEAGAENTDTAPSTDSTN